MEGLNGVEESLYIHCLFKTVSFADVKRELADRIDYNGNESYYVMTLKLRLTILKKASCNIQMQTELEAEIHGLQKKLVKGYNCSIVGCKFSTRNYDNLLLHLKSLHSSGDHKVICQLKGCERELSSVKMLLVHLKICHRTRNSQVLLRQVHLAQQMSKLQCQSVSCGHQQMKTLQELKLHMVKDHTNKMEEVECIFTGCDFQSQKTGSLRSHFTRKHPSQLLDDLKVGIVVSCNELDEQTNEMHTENPESVTSIEDREVNRSFGDETYESIQMDDDDDDGTDEEKSQELFTRALSMTFNSWMNVKNIAYSTVNSIVSEVFSSYEHGVEVTKGRVKDHLLKDGWDVNQVEEFLDKMNLEDPFRTAREELEMEKKRLDYIKSNFEYAKPVTIRLDEGRNNSKKDTMQYIPIKDSLKKFLEDETFIEQKKSDPYYHEPGIIKDVKDGENFRNNQFFQKNPTAVPIILFMDELEVVNPLGAGKCKHKIQCTYWTTLDVIPALRCKVKSIQLCSLVLSRHWKQYGNELCNRKLVEDLKDLEVNGIEIDKPSKKTVKAGLCLVVGDNLGQHQLGEFSCSFSSGFICRVCDANYTDVCKNHYLYSECVDNYKTEILTKQKYDKCADKAIEMENEASEESMGIKGRCVFNELSSFHCVDQLAPCLGHDFFEGCYTYDVQFCLDYIILKEKLLSIEEFNEKIRCVKLSSRDAKNRPKYFKKRALNSKYEGNAGSLRVLSRILTTVLSGILSDSATEKLLIKLHEVSEIITAPTLTVNEVDIEMDEIIMEYLDLRIEAVETMNMPNPRPKHHFLSHYPRAYRSNGPLIAIWAMRMESKHTYFKNTIRTAKNFINPALTCANRHQLAQVSYAFYGLFPKTKYEVPDNSPLSSDVSSITTDLAMQTFFKNLDSQAMIPKQIKIYGTTYESGKVLVIKKVEYGKLTVGLIKAISYFKHEVKFAVKTFEAHQSKYGQYVTTKFLKSHEIVDYRELADYYPLEMIGTCDSFSFVLHHFVSQGHQQPDTPS